MSNIAIQLQQLVRQGMDLKDAAAALEVSLDDAAMAMSTGAKNAGGRLTAQQLAREFCETQGLSVLMDVATDPAMEPKDRIRAIEVIKKEYAGDIEAKGSNLKDRFEAWRNVTKREFLIEDSSKQPIVDVKDIGKKCFELVEQAA